MPVRWPMLVTVISVYTLLRLRPIRSIAAQLPPVQNAEQSVTLMPECPKLSSTLWIRAEGARCNGGRLINGVLILKAILGHDLTGFEHSLVAGKQVMDMHGARVNVFEVGSLQGKGARVAAIHLRV